MMKIKPNSFYDAREWLAADRSSVKERSFVYGLWGKKSRQESDLMPLHHPNFPCVNLGFRGEKPVSNGMRTDYSERKIISHL